jgi:hypothetical protein
VRADYAAKVLTILPEEFAIDVLNRMLRMETVQKEALRHIEAAIGLVDRREEAGLGLPVEGVEHLGHEFVRVAPRGLQTLMRKVDNDTLCRALKGADERVRAFFMRQMSTRAAKNLTDEMGSMGPIRLKEVDEAQAKILAHQGLDRARIELQEILEGEHELADLLGRAAIGLVAAHRVRLDHRPDHAARRARTHGRGVQRLRPADRDPLPRGMRSIRLSTSMANSSGRMVSTLAA